MTTKERQESKKYLKYGDRRIIARLAKVTEQAVGRFISGGIKNSSIELYFEKMVDKRKKELEESFESEI